MRRATPNSSRTKRRGVVAGTVVVVALMLPMASAVAEDLQWDSDVTYSVDLDQGRLHLHSVMTFTNLKPSTTSGNFVTSYYYDRVSFLVPEAAVDITTTSGGTTLSHTIVSPAVHQVSQIEIAFGRRLLYGQQMTVVLDYDVPGDPPRSESTFRVNPAYVNFTAIAWGDPGRASVRIVLPHDFVTDFGGTPYTFDVEDDVIVYQFNDVGDPNDFLLPVQGWDDDRLLTSNVALGDYDIVVKSWPDDPGWSDDVLETVTTGLPVLQELVGLPWRPEETLNIFESQKVTLAGYGGWYVGADEEIHISEWVDPHLVMHELSHTWFNEGLFEERWITEGLANEFAAETVGRAGMVSIDYPRPTQVPADYPGSFYLNDWNFPGPEVVNVDRYERFGYDTSFWVLQEIAEEIGHDKLALVLAAADHNEVAYRSGDLVETVATEEDDWHRFLDLVEEVGGSVRADDLFTEFVTETDLNERASVREDYDRLRETGWDIPLVVRRPMERWEFNRASSYIDDAMTILDRRDAIESNSTALGVEPPASLETEFEAATKSLETVAVIADAQLETSAEVLAAKEAVEADRGLITTVGLIGARPDEELSQAINAYADDDLELAVAEADEVIALVDGAGQAGTNRLIMVGAVIVVAIGSLTVIRVRRRRNRIPGADPGEATTDIA